MTGESWATGLAGAAGAIFLFFMEIAVTDLPAWLLYPGLGLTGLTLVGAVGSGPIARTVVLRRRSPIAMAHGIDDAQHTIKFPQTKAEPELDAVREQLLSVVLYNSRDNGPAVQVVAELVATFSGRLPPDQARFDAKEEGLREVINRMPARQARGHGQWFSSPFGQPYPGRRRDLSPTGERERLGLIVRRTGSEAELLGADQTGIGTLGRGHWSLILTLRGEHIHARRFEFELTDFGEEGPIVLKHVEVDRRFFLGRSRVRVVAQNTASFPSPRRSRGARLRGWLTWRR